MLIEEIKCLEVLIRYMTKNSTLIAEINSEFQDETEFEKHKPNLFNIISINNLLTYYNSNPSFSLESFLVSGIIPNQYPDKTIVPSIDSKVPFDYKAIYERIINALKDNHYIFDEDNNIYISTSEMEATIPQVWLYRLAEAYKRDKYDRIYLFNKQKPTRIKDKKSLIDYIRHTKSFIVSMHTSNPNANYEQAFNDSKSKVDSSLKSEREVKLDQIIKMFKENIPNQYKVSISKYKLSDSLWLIKKIDRLGQSFYDKPIAIQEEIINKFVLAYIKNNEIANKETQKFILLASTKNIYGYNETELKKEDILVGLFNLYISLLNSLEFDFTSISLSDFKIKSYQTEQVQHDKNARRALDELINKQQEILNSISQESLGLFRTIQNLDLVTNFDEITRNNERINALTSQYNEHISLKEELEARKKELVSPTKENEELAIAEIAFDNEKIISLIAEASRKGRIYIQENNIVIELYNSTLSEPTFKCTINIDRLINFIEDINYSLEENNTSLRWGA